MFMQICQTLANDIKHIIDVMVLKQYMQYDG